MATEDTKIKQAEQAHLDYVRGKIKIAEETTAETITKAKQSQKDLEDHFYDDVRLKTSTYEGQMETGVSVRQQQQMLEQRQNRWQSATRDMETLQKLDQNAYFARIDLKEEGEAQPEKIYIGLSSFVNPNDSDEYLIYDWRAPISSVYYDSGVGEMTYNAPSGPQRVDVTLKRELQIKNGKLTQVFDTDEAVGDRVLLENLQHQSDTKMKSIVTTIQKEQNAIIRDTSSDLLFVQGVAGSGKTAAVLQRVAYLLYRYRGNLTPGQVILFSPNQLFNDYINQVLPELGEQNMVQMTYYQFMRRRVPRLTVETLEQRFDESLTDETQNVTTLKNSLTLFAAEGKYADSLNQTGAAFRNIMFQGKVFISKEQINEIYCSFNPNYRLRNRLEATKEKLLQILKQRMGMEMKKRWVEEAVEGLSSEQIEMLHANAGRQRTDDDRDARFLARQVVKAAFAKVHQQIKRNRFFNINQQFVNFLRQVPELVNLSDWHVTLSEWQTSVRATVKRFQNGKISIADVSIYLYLFDLVTGKRPDLKMRYLFIDEVQDYTPFQLAYLQWNYPRAKFTVLGDLNQAIFTRDSSQTLMADLRQLFNPDKIRVIKLLKSYRSTAQITDFTKQLIPDGQDIEAYARQGEIPVLAITKNHEQAVQRLVQTITTNQKAEETTAVIGKTLAECRQIAADLKDRGVSATLIQTENQRLAKGVVIVPAYLAKGLEFDAVVMWDGSKDSYPTDQDDKLVYTICTRAMHRLEIISIGEPSPLFAAVNPTDYQLVKE
ncbi:AAA family ATPase [Fructilactobacillus cliffordii]|uniref:RNA polymerase recycling motor HelD n=1 Tax=Fructilactobacillus cliffordii TaxID=2940299 RepID=UPI002092AED9|nr:RNA polymerase recycling motor HelD [Fructilactobacillus cliffordii]USS86212.1 AAA family ATPase [Fructilactobacillus cliffordii]